MSTPPGSGWQSLLGRVDSGCMPSSHPSVLPLYQPQMHQRRHVADATTEPLLRSAINETRRQGNASDEPSCEAGEQGGLLHEFLQLLFIAAPLFVEGLAAIGEQLVATSCVGHLPQATALSALVLAQAVYNLMGYSIVSGLASALETLCGQAYGAGNHRLLAVMLVRAQMVCLLAVVPAVVLWGSGSMEALLLLSGQQQQISQPASRLLQAMLPALLLSVVSETVVQYALAQGQALPGMVSSLTCLLLSPGLNWGLVYGCGGVLWFMPLGVIMGESREQLLRVRELGLGLIGAGVAASATQALLALIVVAWVLRRDLSRRKTDEDAWVDFSLGEAVTGATEYLHYGLPCVAMVVAEWAVWELIALMAGALPEADVAVAAVGISTQITLLPWMFLYSLGTATATRVAQALGSGSAARARRVFRLACCLTTGASLCLSGALWAGRRPLIRLLTSDAALQTQIETLMPVVAIALVADGQVSVLGAKLRAAGRQGIGAVVTWSSYWCLGMPLCWGLCFWAGMGVMGLRLGLAIAVVCQAVLLHLVTALAIDWDTEVVRAAALVGGSAAASSNGSDGDSGSDIDDADTQRTDHSVAVHNAL